MPLGPDILTGLTSALYGADIAVLAYNDPDGYYFPLIAAAKTIEEAKRLLDTWKTIKTGKYVQQNRGQQEILGIDTQYRGKLSEITAKFTGVVGTTTEVTSGKFPTVATIVVAAAIIYVVYYFYRKGKI